jgi:hypothetical protein
MRVWSFAFPVPVLLPIYIYVIGHHVRSSLVLSLRYMPSQVSPTHLPHHNANKPVLYLLYPTCPEPSSLNSFGQRPRPLHNRYTRTDTCARWVMAVAYSRYKFVAISLPKRLRNGRFASEPPRGSGSGFKNPFELELLVEVLPSRKL